MDALYLDFALPLRSFRLELALAVGRETFALVGPSGAGKTSVLRAVAGLARPERGRIALDGRVLFDASAKIDRPPEDRQVGFVFQEYALFPHMSVEQNVAYGGRDRAAELLERFRIAKAAVSDPWLERDQPYHPRQFSELDPVAGGDLVATLVGPPAEAQR